MISLRTISHYWILILALCLSFVGEAQAIRKYHPWNLKTRSQPDAQAGGWFINLGITGARAKIRIEDPKSLLITYVFKDTPAQGHLQVGDKIVGANGKAFEVAHQFGFGVSVFGYEGPMKALGHALEESQGTLDGKLALDVIRKGKPIQVNLQLPIQYGSFSPSFPFACKKSDLILSELQSYLLNKQRADGLWHEKPHINVFAALTLLASGDPKHLPAARQAAKAFAQLTQQKVSYESLACWKYGLYGIYLAEYYLLTQESWVLPELEEIHRWLSRAQMANGGWAHQPAYSKNLSGFGAINIITLQAKMALALIQRSGLKVEESKLRKAHDFVERGTNALGYVWYKDGGKSNLSYADLGRTGASALAHHLQPNGGEIYRRTVYKNARFIGRNPKTFPDTHGSPLLGMAWTALGAWTQPAMFRKLMDENRWYFALAQCPEGTFYYQPNRGGNPQDYITDPRLCASAVTALILSVKNKNLQLTGAKLVNLPFTQVKLIESKIITKPEKKTPKRKGLFPGLKMNFEQRSLDIESQICLDQGLLELVACTKDSKEHESIVVIDAKPKHIHTALLLLGAKPGNPALRKQVGETEKRWVDIPPRGDPIEVFLVIKNSKKEWVERPISEFIQPSDESTDEKFEKNSKKKKFEHSFVFSGSHYLSKEEKYICDLSGHVISISTFGDELLCLPEIQSRDAGLLQWKINSSYLPPKGTKVTLRLKIKKPSK